MKAHKFIVFSVYVFLFFLISGLTSVREKVTVTFVYCLLFKIWIKRTPQYRIEISLNKTGILSLACSFFFFFLFFWGSEIIIETVLVFLKSSQSPSGWYSMFHLRTLCPSLTYLQGQPDVWLDYEGQLRQLVPTAKHMLTTYCISESVLTSTEREKGNLAFSSTQAWASIFWSMLKGDTLSEK